MAKNINIEVPKDAETEVDNVKKLKTSVFTRTRIALLCAVLVLALSVASTLAYIQWTANQTPNRDGVGTVEIEIVETVKDKDGNASAADTGDGSTTSATAGVGEDTKVVKVKSDGDTSRVDEVVRVQFVPEMQSASVDGANVALTEFWGTGEGDGIKQDATTNKYYLETSALKLWIADDWASNWLYKQGAFYYKKTLAKDETTPELLEGVTLQDTTNKNDYASIKVKVVADAMQCEPEGALDEWGVKVTDNADGTKDVTLKSDDTVTP